MPKTAVQTAVCDICGAEVRDGSLFCYNCGGSVSNAVEPDAIAAPIADPIDVVSEPVEPTSNGTAASADKVSTELMSDRRKVRAANRQPTEIVWEPRQGAWAFVIAATVFVIVALVLVVAAFYLR